MKSALEIIAFSNQSQVDGTIALLQTSLKALDRAGDHMAAAYVDLALQGYVLRLSERRDRNFDDLQNYG